MSLFSILFSFILGWGIIRWLTPRAKVGTFEDIFLAWGVGALVVSQITLYSILPFGNLIPPLTCALTLLFTGTLWFILARNPQRTILKVTTVPEIFLVGFMIFCTILFLYQALIMPYGFYDGWSLWNYRAVSVFRGGETWTGIFHNEVQGKHPWLLPLFVVWGWCFTGEETTGIPIFIAVFTALATMGLLVTSLTEEIGGWKALLAGLFLFFIPFFSWHSVSQYASIVVAYYMLGACVCLKKTLDDTTPKYWILSAIFLGALAFSKDEGLILALACLASYFIFLKRRSAHVAPVFWQTLTGVSVALIIVEILMRTTLISSAPYIKSNFYEINPDGILDATRWKAIGDFMWNEIILHAEFGRLRLWLPLCLLGILTPVGRFILGSVTVYSAMFLFLYLIVAQDLVWRMNVTADRLLFQILPVLVYLLFYALFFKKPQTLSNSPGTTND